MVSAEQRDKAVAAQKAEQKAQDAQRDKIQGQVEASNIRLHNAPGSTNAGKTFAQIQLERLYGESGVITDSSGRIIHSGADLGASREAEEARRAGRPTPIITGTPSKQYLDSVAAAGIRRSDILNQRSTLAGAAAQKRSEAARLTARESEIQRQLQSIESQLNAPQVLGSTYTDKNTGQKREIYQSPLGSEAQDRLLSQRQSLEAERKTIQSRRSELGDEIGSISTAEQSLIKQRNAADPRRQSQSDSLKNLLGVEPRGIAPQRERIKTTPSQGAGLFSNPNFVTREQQAAREQLEFSGILKGTETERQNETTIFNQFGDAIKNAGGLMNPLPQAFGETAPSNLQRTDNIKDTISKAKAAGAKEITITGESGFTKTVPIGSAYREIIAASRNEAVSLSASGVGRKETIISLEESLNISPQTGGGRPGGEIIDLVNQPRQITATSILEREQKKTGLDLSLFAPAAEFLDKTFELGTPKELRSNQSRKIPGVPKELFSGISNRGLAEGAAPISNLAGDIFDLGRVTVQTAQGKVKYETKKEFDPSNLFNLPTPTKDSFQRLPRQKTALGEIFEGKAPDFSKTSTQESLAGEAFLVGGIDLAFRAVGKTAGKVSEIRQTSKDVKQIRKDLENAPPPATKSTEVIPSIESALNPKTRINEIIPSFVKNVIEKPRTTKGKIKVSKVSDNIYDIEGNNPAAQSIVRAERAGKNQEFFYNDFRAPTTGGKPQASIIGELGAAEQSRFNLIPVKGSINRFVSKGAAKPDLITSLTNDIVTPVARQRTFTAKQVREGGADFGAYFFGDTRTGFVPAAPLSDLLFFETRYSRMAGTRVGKGGLLKNQPAPLDLLRPETFRGFGKEKTITTREKIRQEKPREIIDIDEFLGRPKRENTANEGSVFYHGTTKSSAKKILKSGFDTNIKRRFSGSRDDSVYLTPEIDTAKTYSGYLSPKDTRTFDQIMKDRITLKVTLKKDAKIFDPENVAEFERIFGKGEVERDAAVLQLKKLGYSGIKGKSEVGKTVELFDTGAVAKIERQGAQAKGKPISQRIRNFIDTSIDPALMPKGSGRLSFPNLFEETRTKVRKSSDSYIFDVRVANEKGRRAIDPFTDMTKFQPKQKSMLERMFDEKKKRGQGTYRTIDDFGKSTIGGKAQITKTELKQTQEKITPKSETKQREDAFGTIPFFDTDTRRGSNYVSYTEFYGSVLEPSSITSRRPVSGMVERIRGERIQDLERFMPGGANIVDPLGQLSPSASRKKGESKRMRDVFKIDPFATERGALNILPSILTNVRPRTSQPTRTRQPTITDLIPRVTEIIDPIQGQVPKQRTTTRTTTDQIITQIFPPTFRPPREDTTTTNEFFFPRGKLPFLFPSGYGGGGKGKGRGKKSFSYFNVGYDIGVIEQAGSPSILTSESPDIFDIGDKKVRRAADKEKKRKKNGGIMIGTERGAIGRAVNAASIRAGRQIGRQSKKAPSSLRNPSRPQRSQGRRQNLNLGKANFRI